MLNFLGGSILFCIFAAESMKIECKENEYKESHIAQ